MLRHRFDALRRLERAARFCPFFETARVFDDVAITELYESRRDSRTRGSSVTGAIDDDPLLAIRPDDAVRSRLDVSKRKADRSRQMAFLEACQVASVDQNEIQAACCTCRDPLAELRGGHVAWAARLGPEPSFAHFERSLGPAPLELLPAGIRLDARPGSWKRKLRNREIATAREDDEIARRRGEALFEQRARVFPPSQENLFGRRIVQFDFQDRRGFGMHSDLRREPSRNRLRCILRAKGPALEFAQHARDGEASRPMGRFAPRPNPPG